VTKKIIIAGFGGQGIILAGKLLAYSAMLEGKEVTHFASYGAEMRGGTCNCSVIVSDKTISSPIVNNADIILTLNKPSKDKFESACLSDGTMILNKSLINEDVKRNDLKSYYIDASNEAAKLGNVKITNMIMLGALSKITNVVKLETLKQALTEVISSRNKALIEINSKALETGYNLS
jgi:2-oxoglutarate ferredoxin oxidoreductase subunit gamma